MPDTLEKPKRKWEGNRKPRKGSWIPVCLGVEMNWTPEGRAELRRGLEQEIKRKEAKR